MGLADFVTKHHEALLNAQTERWPHVVSRHEIDANIAAIAGPDGTSGKPGEIVDGIVQKALVVALKAKLDADPALNQKFGPTVKNALVQQLLVAARVKELAKARIVKKGGAKKLRYDVGELAQTFYGKQILESVGLKRQRVLDKDEIEKLVAACAKVKLTLPEAVEPTTTGVFFDDSKAAEVTKSRASRKKKPVDDDDEDAP